MARKDSREVVKPLLYIAQPELEEAKLNIQHSYVVKVNKQDQKTKNNEYVESFYEEEINQIEDVVVDEEDEEVEDVIDQPELENKQDNGWVKKPFKAMTNEEKVQFMVNKPHYIPKVECRIRTQTDLYIGYIVSYTDGKVGLKVQSSINNIEIPLEEIDSIQMVGI